LVDKRSEHGRVWPDEYRAEGHHSRLSFVPVLLLDVRLNEGDHCGDNRVVNCLGEERKACASGHGNIPFSLLSILILASKEQEEHGNDFRKCNLGEVLGRVDISIEEALSGCINRTRPREKKIIAYLLGIEVIAFEVGFFLSNRRPKLDRLQRDSLLF
jgi:hypothetical protein